MSKFIEIQTKGYNYFFERVGVNFQGKSEKREKKVYHKTSAPPPQACATLFEKKRHTAPNTFLEGETW